jgi:sialic acid synthase SpsE
MLNKLSIKQKNKGYINTAQDVPAELALEHHSLLIEDSKQCDIESLSTAFGIDSLAFLNSLDSRVIKIPSEKIANLP